MSYHHRTATIALALALAAGVPAAAAAQQPGQLNSPAPPSPCSEVCSGGGYTSATGTTTSPAAILNGLGNPAPCSEVCSGGGYGSVSTPSRTPDHSSADNTATIPPAAVHVAAHSYSFHWGDAGIGAGGTLALTVIGICGALTLTRRRNQHIQD